MGRRTSKRRSSRTRQASSSTAATTSTRSSAAATRRCQIVFPNCPDLYHTSSESGERQYKSGIWKRRFGPHTTFVFARSAVHVRRLVEIFSGLVTWRLKSWRGRDQLSYTRYNRRLRRVLDQPRVVAPLHRPQILPRRYRPPQQRGGFVCLDLYLKSSDCIERQCKSRI